MKFSSALTIALLMATALFVSACGNSTPTTPTSTTATPTVTESFTGTFDSTGSKVNTFNVAAAGEVDATLTAETVLVNGAATPSTIALGFILGSWDGTNCTAGYENDNSRTGTVLSGTTTASGPFCVKLFDVGNITPGSPVTYTVTVAHP